MLSPGSYSLKKNREKKIALDRVGGVILCEESRKLVSYINEQSGDERTGFMPVCGTVLRDPPALPLSLRPPVVVVEFGGYFFR